jgi:L-lactate dehydrogenase (cytochrome)
MLYWEGETAVAKAAQHYGALYAPSTPSTPSIADIAQVHKKGCPKVFQLYVWKGCELVKEMLVKAKKGSFRTLALTVDLAHQGNGEGDIRSDFSVPQSTISNKR